MTKEDEATFKELGCGCLKEFQYEQRKHRTAGVLALVSSCGLYLKIETWRTLTPGPTRDARARV